MLMFVSMTYNMFLFQYIHVYSKFLTTIFDAHKYSDIFQVNLSNSGELFYMLSNLLFFK